MHVIILAGGRGTRLAEETGTIPKPMVPVAGKPLLWHIMNIYARQGFMNFTVATGYLSHVIDDWAKEVSEPWSIKTIFTGLDTQTGGRIRQCIESQSGEIFLVTYGDGLANVNLSRLIRFHKENSFEATLTAVKPPARFGVVDIVNGVVSRFGEKLQKDSDWINGGFFVLNRGVVSYIEADDEPFETGALPRLTENGMLGGYQHLGFWKPMDTLREKQEFEKIASGGDWPWLLSFE